MDCSLYNAESQVRTTVKIVRAFESGEKAPTLRQLNELSRAYQRPLVAFPLSKPPQEKPMPKDYRMLPERKDVFDRKTILVLRKPGAYRR